MFKTVCSKCGKECEVPFRPSGDRPVFCSECFQNSRGQNNSRNFQDRGLKSSFREPVENRSQNNEQLGEINRKLDKIMEILTVKPQDEAPTAVEGKATEVKVERKKKASKKVVPVVKV